MQALNEGIRIAKRWYTGPAWDGLLTGFLGPDPDNSTQSPTEYENAFKASVDQFGHPVGTAAMSSPASKEGVVDHTLKVKGVDGLRVVDASAIVGRNQYMPTRFLTDLGLALRPDSTHTGICLYFS
jgi:choline dehydrogenase